MEFVDETTYILYNILLRIVKKIADKKSDDFSN